MCPVRKRVSLCAGVPVRQKAVRVELTGASFSSKKKRGEINPFWGNSDRLLYSAKHEERRNEGGGRSIIETTPSSGFNLRYVKASSTKKEGEARKREISGLFTRLVQGWPPCEVIKKGEKKYRR